MFSVTQDILSIPENTLPLQGAGFPSEAGKSFKTAVLQSEATAYVVSLLNPK